METVLRYRQYGCDELRRFFGDTAFYSRSSHFRANCPGRPDALRTSYETESGNDVKGGRIRVILQLEHCGRITSRNQGMIMRGAKFPPSAYNYRVREGQPTSILVNEVQKALHGILDGLPIVMYATAHARQVFNYGEFMSSAVNKKRHSDITALIQSGRIKVLSTIPLTHYGLIEKNGLDQFHVMQLIEGFWVAWIDGDDLIPVFLDELIAYRFMKDRLMLYEGFKRKTYDELFGESRVTR
ncbi:MAG: hypothetical protein RIN56_13220 [Sporomusaceae bacterium]|nr:hypothetical protein [Sporomusaceae bacterium]